MVNSDAIMVQMPAVMEGVGGEAGEGIEVEGEANMGGDRNPFERAES